MFATELISNLLKQFFKSKRKANVFINSIIGICLVCGLLIIVFPHIKTSDAPQNIEVQLPQKSKDELIAEKIEKTVEKIEASVENWKLKRDEKDSMWNANKNQRWVYQIGDIMEDDNALEKLYNQIKNIDHICAFKTGKKYFFFKEIFVPHSLKDSLEYIQSKVGSNIKVDTVDIIESYCDRKRDNITVIKQLKLGKRKDRVEIPCYAAKK
jgi:hypothetical protein